MRREVKVETKFYDDDGTEIKVGDMVTFFFGGRQLVGRFLGTDKRNTITISSKLGDMAAEFHVTENKIDELHKCKLEVGGSIG